MDTRVLGSPNHIVIHILVKQIFILATQSPIAQSIGDWVAVSSLQVCSAQLSGNPPDQSVVVSVKLGKCCLDLVIGTHLIATSMTRVSYGDYGNYGNYVNYVNYGN